MGLLDLFRRPIQRTKVRDGLWSFADDTFRAEIGPRMVAVEIPSITIAAPDTAQMTADEVMRVEAEHGEAVRKAATEAIATALAQAGAGLRYLTDMKDALGNPLEPGRLVYVHAWADRAQHSWHLYRWRDGAWDFIRLYDGDEAGMLAEMEKEIRHGVHS